METVTLANANSRLSTAQIKELFEECAEMYRLRVKKNELMKAVTVESKFGGEPYSEEESWPTCKQCEKPLSFIFQFNNASFPSLKKIDTHCLFVFYMCFECPYVNLGENSSDGLWQMKRYLSPSLDRTKKVSSHLYQFVRPSSIQVLYEKNLPELERWDEQHMVDNADTASVRKLLDSIALSNDPDSLIELYQEIAEKLVHCPIKTVARSRYLGNPYTYNPLTIPQCSNCAKSMNLLFQIGWEDEADFGFGDDGYIYIFYCQDHQEIMDFRALG